MKRKFLDRRGWKRIIEQSTQIERIEQPEEGWMALIKMKSVSQPLYVNNCGRKLKVADNGFQWLHFMPDHEEYVMTAMIDDHGKLIQIYYDIVWQTGYDKKNNGLWFDDLYLDVVLMPNGSWCLLDEDELLEALETGDITEEMYRHAYEMSQKLIENIKLDDHYFLEMPFILRQKGDHANGY
jgi:uncharacterized protein